MGGVGGVTDLNQGETLHGAGLEMNQRMQKSADSAIWLFLVTLPSLLVWLLPLLAVVWIGYTVWRRVNSRRWRLPISNTNHDPGSRSAGTESKTDA